MSGGDDHEHVPFADEDLDELRHLAERQGADGVRVAGTLLGDELRAKGRTRRVVELVASVAIASVIFVRLIPTWFDVEYRQVWQLLGDADPRLVGFTVAFWFFTMWCYAGVLATSLPGLSRMQGMTTNFSGSALANVLPFGGAAGTAATYAQCLSWGHDVAAITLSIVVTGIWNLFAKLGLPIVVLALLGVAGEESHGFAVPTAIGLGVLAASIALFASVIRSERLARSLATGADNAAAGARRLLRRRPADGPTMADRVVDFRDRSVDLVRRRWIGLTVWMVAYKVSQALLQLLCARAVGIELGVIEIVAVYAFGELLTTISVTPSGVGFVEVGSAGLLQAFGAPADQALAAVLLYRAFTYLFEIPLGIVGWITWASVRRWRRPPGSITARP